MFMTNIPRRKIYEIMLELEEHILELQILIRSQENFNKFKTQYKDTYNNLADKYKKIVSLFILFFENKEYGREEDFQKDLNYYFKEEKLRIQIIKKSKNLSKDFKHTCEILDEKFKQKKTLETIDEGVQLFSYIDKFNSAIPSILELRRDEIK